MFIYVLFLCFVALAVGDPHSRVPYGQLRAQNVMGLPPGVKISHPSNLPLNELQLIYNMGSIKFVGMLATRTCTHLYK